MAHSQAILWATLRVPEAMGEEVAAWLVAEGALGAQSLDRRDLHWSSAAYQALDLQGPPALAAGEALICAGFPPQQDAAQLRAQLRGVLDTLQLTDCAESIQIYARTVENALICWKQHFTPLSIGKRFVVVPSWERASFKAPAGAHVLEIEPGMAFGTGQHATTALCLQALEATFEQEGPHYQPLMADVGCGSGILALGGAMLGAARILAVDVCPTAVETAQANVAKHNLQDKIRCVLPPWPVPQQFDLIVANILANPLMELAPTLLGHLRLGGRLILSGLLENQLHSVVESYQKAAGYLHLAVCEESIWQDNEWVAAAYVVQSAG